MVVLFVFGGTRMAHPIERHLSDLPTLDRPALRDLWKEHFGAFPPTQLRKDLMIPILAYRIQEKTFRPLSANARNRLRQLGQAFKQSASVPVSSGPQIKPGTRLMREWREQVHLVNVEVHGYEYRGGRYKSLSQIARLITGTRWSGPAFFGLKQEQTSGEEEI
jgi:hypothetical protein